ncbi:hypothetical protein ACOMHN_018313 [Nucella lapillus]
MEETDITTETDVVVIGGGISGLVAGKCLKEDGFKVVILEKSGEIGGLWNYRENDYGVMRCTHINVSKYNYCFSDYPFPDHVTDYPHHTEMAQYIVGYAQHFKLLDFIRFHSKVTRITQKGEKWEVVVDKLDEEGQTLSGETKVIVCRFLVIASGHHAKPSRASFPGEDTFTGEILHSVDYKDPLTNGFVGKRVLIVGIGNSAVDAAVDCATVGRCKSVCISSRSGAWIIPNYIFGFPTDLYACRAFFLLPWKLASKVLESVIKVISGNPKKAQSYTRAVSTQSYIRAVSTQSYIRAVSTQSYIRAVSTQSYIRAVSTQSYIRAVSTQSYIRAVSTQSYIRAVSTQSYIRAVSTQSYTRAVCQEHRATSGLSAHKATSGLSAHRATSGLSAHKATSGLSAHKSTPGLSAKSTELHQGCQHTELHQSCLPRAQSYIRAVCQEHRATSGLSAHRATSGLSAHRATSGLSAHKSTPGLSAKSTELHQGCQHTELHQGCLPRAQSYIRAVSTQSYIRAVYQEHRATSGLSAHRATSGLSEHRATSGLSAHRATSGLSPHRATSGLSAHRATSGLSAKSTELHQGCQHTELHQSCLPRAQSYIRAVCQEHRATSELSAHRATSELSTKSTELHQSCQHTELHQSCLPRAQSYIRAVYQEHRATSELSAKSTELHQSCLPRAQSYIRAVSTQSYIRAVRTQSYIRAVSTQSYIRAVSTQSYIRAVTTQSYIRAVSTQSYIRDVCQEHRATSELSAHRATSELSAKSTELHQGCLPRAQSYIRAVSTQSYIRAVSTQSYIRAVCQEHRATSGLSAKSTKLHQGCLHTEHRATSGLSAHRAQSYIRAVCTQSYTRTVCQARGRLLPRLSSGLMILSVIAVRCYCCVVLLLCGLIAVWSYCCVVCGRWGLNPKMRVLQTQPTVSPTLIHHIQRKNITIMPNIAKIEGSTVQFGNGQEEEFDKIVYCTGYKIDLPYLSDDLRGKALDDDYNAINLFKNVFCPSVGPSLAFIGFVQPASGGVLTMSEIQARWFGQVCKGNVRLPPKHEMEQDIRQEKMAYKERWYNSTRHTIQRDPIVYNDQIAAFFGAKPGLLKHPDLAWRLMFSSCGAAQWRLQGPGQWSDAAKEVRKVPMTDMMNYAGCLLLLLLLLVFYYLLCFFHFCVSFVC